MNDYTRKPPGHECPPPDQPADQPHPPTGGCADLPTTTPPVLDPPAKCPPPGPPCHCPVPPDSNSNCLEGLIEQQAGQIIAGTKAADFKKQLDQLLTKSKDAAKVYTPNLYADLIKQWQDEDRDIVELISRVLCLVPCWRCIIECYVCPLLNQLRESEQWLYGDGSLYGDVHNLHDLRYWLERDLAAKKRTLDRTNAVLAVWQSPQNIKAILIANRKVLEAYKAARALDPSAAIVDVFLKLIPMHLAIAPPATSPETTTKIAKEYTQFCGCDVGTPDDCCGPDVGEGSFRQRILGPQPYLVNPNDYFKILCCLVEKRFRPAQDAVVTAEAALQATENDITRRKAQIEAALKQPGAFEKFEKDAKAAIPSDIDCCDCESEKPATPNSSQRR